jgi:hypothetical protein
LQALHHLALNITITTFSPLINSVNSGYVPSSSSKKASSGAGDGLSSSTFLPAFLAGTTTFLMGKGPTSSSFSSLTTSGYLISGACLIEKSV